MLFVTLGVFALIAYVIGSFPTAIIVGKLTKGIDIREHGSGNAGGTNVFRVLGWQLGVFVMLVDLMKGFLAAKFVPFIPLEGLEWPMVYQSLFCGAFAIIGHIWTVFAGFKGGKGVGTAAGLLFAVIPQAALVGLIVFFSIFFSTRYVSLASMVAATSIPLTLILQRTLFGGEPDLVMMIITSVLAALILYTHRANIKRLLAGNENKITSLKGGTHKFEE